MSNNFNYLLINAHILMSHTWSATIEPVVVFARPTSLTRGLRPGWTSRSTSVVRNFVRLSVSVYVQTSRRPLKPCGSVNLLASKTCLRGPFSALARHILLARGVCCPLFKYN